MARGPAMWVRRGLLAAVLIGVAIIPGRASSVGAQRCTGLHCKAPGSILWTRALPGSWVVQPGVSGTVTSQSPAYAASGGGLAVVAAGTSVTAFAATTGVSLWQVEIADLAGIPAGSVITGVRAFDGVVAVGVEPAATTSAATAGSAGKIRSAGTGQAGSRHRAGTGSAGKHRTAAARTLAAARRSFLASGRYEVILSAATGVLIRSYPASPYGGAIAADRSSAVIVGSQTVTAYSNSTGQVLWSRATGPVGESWRVSGQYVYVSVTAAGDAAQVTALRRISLRTGEERIVRPEAAAFTGDLTSVIGDVALFSGANGVWAYDAQTGKRRWNIPSAVLELTDAGRGIVYLAVGNRLDSVEAASTGDVLSHAASSVAGSLYSVTDGVALGLDQNALGEAWGYSLATRKIVWTSAGLPWPHYFIDPAGLGGSISADGGVLLLASCGEVGPAASATAAPSCLRPELSAVLT